MLADRELSRQKNRQDFCSDLHAEYLAPAESPPVHLLRILPADEMRATFIEKTDISSQQVSLFDSQ